MDVARGNQEDPRGVAFAKRCFTLEDQRAFAEFCGDFNPVHLDPLAARRTIAGSVVVHGIHATLWALDRFLADHDQLPGRLSVNFKKPILLDEEVECRYQSERRMISIWLGDARLVDISLKPGELDAECPLSPQGAPAEQAALLTETDVDQPQTHPLRFRGDPQSARVLFPVLGETLGVARVCDLAATSEIVGMRVPGLHSLYLSLQADFTAKNGLGDPRYTLESFDSRFRIANIQVETASLSARISALLRPPPTKIPALSEIAPDVGPGEFKDVDALIVGGSRGLGEATAKIIARGGGKVTLTYRTGADDAERIVQQICDNGGRARALQLDVLDRDQIAALDTGAINQLYFFATPKIFGKRGSKFDSGMLESFRSFYVEAFELLVHHFLGNEAALATFYPSTTALDEPLPELAEYIRAKAEGEAICATLDQAPGHTVLYPRIPRTHTDQTAALVSVAASDPIDVMLPFVREMNAHTGGVGSNRNPGA